MTAWNAVGVVAAVMLFHGLVLFARARVRRRIWPDRRSAELRWPELAGLGRVAARPDHELLGAAASIASLIARTGASGTGLLVVAPGSRPGGRQGCVELEAVIDIARGIPTMTVVGLVTRTDGSLVDACGQLAHGMAVAAERGGAPPDVRFDPLSVASVLRREASSALPCGRVLVGWSADWGGDHEFQVVGAEMNAAGRTDVVAIDRADKGRETQAAGIAIARG